MILCSLALSVQICSLELYIYLFAFSCLVFRLLFRPTLLSKLLIAINVNTLLYPSPGEALTGVFWESMCCMSLPLYCSAGIPDTMCFQCILSVLGFLCLFNRSVSDGDKLIQLANDIRGKSGDLVRHFL